MGSAVGWLLIFTALPFAGAVDPPIAGRPPTFTGGVGQFKVRSNMTTQEPKVGQPIVVELTMTGTGDVSRLKAPNLETAGKFADDFIVADVTETATDHGKTFRYSLLAKTSGRRRIPPIRVSFFNPAANRYETIATTSLEMDVAPAKDVSWSEVTLPQSPRAVWPWCIVGGILFAFGGYFVWRRQTSRAVARRITLRKERMSESERLIDQLADYLELPLGNRTTPEILAALSQRDIQGRLQRCLELLDRRRFGPEKQLDDDPANVDALRQLVDQIVK